MAKKNSTSKNTSAKRPKAKKEKTIKAAKEPKAFAHDPRVLPFVGKDLTHTERGGTVHTCRVLEDGFQVDGVRYNSATAAAKPLQPTDDDGKTRAVNGLVYWNVVKTKRPAITPEAALDKAATAVERAIEKCLAAIEAAGDGKKTDVRRAIAQAAKRFEKLLKSVAA